MKPSSPGQFDSGAGSSAVPAGNYYNKHESANPIAQRLMAGFYGGLDLLARQVEYRSIHEVGCGEGYLLSRFAGRGLRLWGSDLSPEIVEEARARVCSLQADASFQVRSLYDLTARDGAELVLCCEVLEHVEETQRALDVLAEMAQPYLIASVPREPIWRVLNMARGRYWGAWGNTPGHVQHWSRGDFLKLLSSRFEIMQVVCPLPWTMVLVRSRKYSPGRSR